MTRLSRAAAAALLVAACARTQRVHPPEGRGDGAREVPEGRGDGAGVPEGRGSGAGIPPEPGRPRVPAAPEALLRREAVVELQGALAERGLLGDHREGALDAPTSAAIRRFQERRGLAATGFPDRETLKDLGVDPERAYVREDDRRRMRGEGGGGR